MGYPQMASPKSELQRAKAIVRDYHAALGLEKGPDDVRVAQALENHYSSEVILHYCTNPKSTHFCTVCVIPSVVIFCIVFLTSTHVPLAVGQILHLLCGPR